MSQENFPRASIVIPAHNEESVISRCLESVLASADAGEFEIVVACNGCNDRTAEFARQWPGVHVAEISVRSKTAALNEGDRVATSFPRIYLDADIVVSTFAVRKLVTYLRGSTPLVGAPPVVFDTSQSSAAVRAFYRVWQMHPYFSAGKVGSGMVGVNESAHSRIAPFPDITNDDEWIRRHFPPHQRVTPPNCEFVVSAPRKLEDLIKIKTRSRRGNMELVNRYPALKASELRGESSLAIRIGRSPHLFLHALVYVYVGVQTTWRAKRTILQYHRVWERDSTSRVVCDSTRE